MTECAIDWEKTARKVTQLISLVNAELDKDQDEERRYKQALIRAIETNTICVPYHIRQKQSRKEN